MPVSLSFADYACIIFAGMRSNQNDFINLFRQRQVVQQYPPRN
jgi:hypothetical protein